MDDNHQPPPLAPPPAAGIPPPAAGILLPLTFEDVIEWMGVYYKKMVDAFTRRMKTIRRLKPNASNQSVIFREDYLHRLHGHIKNVMFSHFPIPIASYIKQVQHTIGVHGGNQYPLPKLRVRHRDHLDREVTLPTDLIVRRQPGGIWYPIIPSCHLSMFILSRHELFTLLQTVSANPRTDSERYVSQFFSRHNDLLNRNVESEWSNEYVVFNRYSFSPSVVTPQSLGSQFITLRKKSQIDIVFNKISDHVNGTYLVHPPDRPVLDDTNVNVHNMFFRKRPELLATMLFFQPLQSLEAFSIWNTNQVKDSSSTRNIQTELSTVVMIQPHVFERKTEIIEYIKSLHVQSQITTDIVDVDQGQWYSQVGTSGSFLGEYYKLLVGLAQPECSYYQDKYEDDGNDDRRPTRTMDRERLTRLIFSFPTIIQLPDIVKLLYSYRPDRPIVTYLWGCDDHDNGNPEIKFILLVILSVSTDRKITLCLHEPDIRVGFQSTISRLEFEKQCQHIIGIINNFDITPTRLLHIINEYHKHIGERLEQYKKQSRQPGHTMAPPPYEDVSLFVFIEQFLRQEKKQMSDEEWNQMDRDRLPQLIRNPQQVSRNSQQVIRRNPHGPAVIQIM